MDIHIDESKKVNRRDYAWMRAQLGPLKSEEDAKRWAMLVGQEISRFYWLRALTCWFDPKDSILSFWMDFRYGWWANWMCWRFSRRLPDERRRKYAALFCQLYHTTTCRGVRYGAIRLCAKLGRHFATPCLLEMQEDQRTDWSEKTSILKALQEAADNVCSTRSI